MTNVRRLGRVTALTVVALALTSGVASSASPGKGTKPSVKGSVTSVNGVNTPGTCGTPDDNGLFVVTTPAPTPVDTTVTVTTATAFAEHRVATPSFADVCVGDVTTVVGTNLDHAMTALAVAVTVPKATHLFGLVTTVNGDPTQGTCGVAGADGNFTMETVVNSTPTNSTVYVNAATSFVQRHVPGASFANVCVGDQADAVGPSADGAVVADLVTVRIPKRITIKGTVATVNGDPTTGTCGVASTAGGLTVQVKAHGASLLLPVAVTTSTTYADSQDPAPSFADVCVGTRVVAIGTSTAGTLSADAVAVYPPKV